MDIIDDYLAYLEDNPRGYWFKRKPYGYGWTPARWQGWMVFVGYLAFVFGYLFIGLEVLTTEPSFVSVAMPIGVATVLFFVIAWRTGEPLKWQWGIERRSRLK